MKIALVHDYLKEYGGAELVLETLSDLFPDAPIYTSLYCPQYFGPHRARLEKKWGNRACPPGRVHQSFFQYIPLASRLISPLRLLSPLAFQTFDFQTFDLIISSATGAYFPNSLNKKSAKLICYCHTPPRYLYGLPTARNFTANKFIAAIVAVINHFLRLFDFSYAQNVDQFIANSQTTAARIQKFYRRNSVVINPPVELPKKLKIENCEAKRSPPLAEKLKIPGNNYYLAGGRLARAKRYDIAIQACNQLKVPLKVFGRDFAGIESELRSIAGPTIEFIGEITNEEKYRLMSQAQAFIFCSDNEDFGIMPVEAMACGTPVIGYQSGGITETVIDGKTGVLFDQLTPASCAAAIRKFQKIKINPSDCLSRARQFSRDIFIKKIQKIIN